MFYLHVSNRTENLLRHLAEVIRVDKQQDLFAQELFLIQSQGMERMIGQSLADEFRSFCNFKFFLPLDFLGFIADRLGMAISPDGFQRSILAWRIDGLLRDLANHCYRPLLSYLSTGNVELKRFQLARRLANIFDQYQIMRPEMLEKWQQGSLATSDPAELWQMDLWQRLLSQPGGELHRGMQFSRVIKRLTSGEDLGRLLPRRISVVGLHTLPPIFLTCLNCLSRHMHVHLYLLSPCRRYWGDVVSRKMQFKARLRQPLSQTESGPEQHHPLLAALGGQGRDLQNMMLQSCDFDLEFTSYDDPLENRDRAQATLLHRLQSDLLEGSLEEDAQRSPAADDDSILLVSCHSKLRELQILLDHLLRLLHGDEDLQLREIVVMAPDIQEYAQLIPAVFADMQHSIADRSIRRRNTVIAAFLRFLDLFSGRFGWSELLDLLQQQVIFPQFQLSAPEIDTLRQWVIGCGIRWGLSAEQRSVDGLLSYTEGSWRAGLDRLLMGYAIDSDEWIDGVLPFTDIEGRGALALGGLCRFIELIEEARADFQQARTVGEWSATLQSFVQQLFGDAYQEDLVELRTIVAELSESIAAFHEDKVSFEVIRHWFNQSAGESRSSSGFLRGQLTFCSMLPMRSIPFKVVCLIGLNDGVFPKNDNHDTFDLLGQQNRPGDRSPRADDRYQFLEALLAARSHLYLSYIGQSARSNEEIPPSVVVTEFLEVLEAGYGLGAKDFVVRHPLHPFSRKYFAAEGERRLFSYDSYACRTATVLQQGAKGQPQWWGGELARKIDTVQFEDLLRFYRNPQKFFIRDCLDIRLDATHDLPDEREIFQLSGIDRYQAEQEMVSLHLNGKTGDFYRKFQTAGKWPLGTPGRLSFDEKQPQIEEFVARVGGQEMGERLADMPIDLIIDDYRLQGTLSNLYEGGVMLIRYGKMRGADLLSGWLHHLVYSRLLPATKTSIVTAESVVTFSGERKQPGLGTLLSLFAAGCCSPSELYIEPAFVYARQQSSKWAKSSPLDKAVQDLSNRLQNGYEPEWRLLLGDEDGGNVLGEEFEWLCKEIVCPIWGGRHD